MRIARFVVYLISTLLVITTMAAAATPLIIAHRGASGYLPEHTLAAKAMAHAMGADFLEQDVVLTHDGVPVVLHDIYLDTTTDVAERFPGRQRDDGRYYALDFTLSEIRTLSVGERREDLAHAAFPQRFPAHSRLFQVASLADELSLIRGLNHSTGRTAGVYLELKAPQWHAAQGYNMITPVLEVLRAYGYLQTPGQVFLQCFDADTLRTLRAAADMPYQLIQLIGENSWDEDGHNDYTAMRSDAGLDDVQTYADGIGPWLMQLVATDDAGRPASNGLTERAHQRGLLVHPYTLRKDQLPPWAADHDTVLQVLVNEIRVDGVFTDFPDLMKRFLENR
jgi:glycerophosphoryl diester phosphodiesterase